MAEIDPVIEAVFGPAPDGVDLKASVTVEWNTISCVVLGLSTISVALRFYIRTMHNTQMKNLGIDDHTILLGLICTAALVASTLIAGSYGSGTHIWSNDIDRLMSLLKVVFAEPWVYAASVTSTKISILLLYRRLFYVAEAKTIGIDRVFAIMFWIAAFFTCVYPIIMWTVMAAACRPVSFYWRQYAGATDGYCIDVLEFYLVFGIINMVNDIIILAVPIPRILRLHMNKKKKASIAGIMLLGSFVCVASVVRIHYLDRLTKELDVSWILGPAFAWSNLEPSVAIISACLPAFAPLFRGLRNKGSSNNASGKINSSGGYLNSGHTRLQDSHQAPSFCQDQSEFRIEDDEVQLTSMNGISHTQGRDSLSENNSSFDHTIVVKTQFQVVTSER